MFIESCVYSMTIPQGFIVYNRAKQWYNKAIANKDELFIQRRSTLRVSSVYMRCIGIQRIQSEWLIRPTLLPYDAN